MAIRVCQRCGKNFDQPHGRARSDCYSCRPKVAAPEPVGDGRCVACRGPTGLNAKGKYRLTCSSACQGKHGRGHVRQRRRGSPPGPPCVVCSQRVARKKGNSILGSLVCSAECVEVFLARREERNAVIAEKVAAVDVDPSWSPKLSTLITEIRSSIVTVKLATAELRAWVLWSRGLGPRPGDEVKPEPERLDGWAGYSQMHGGER